MKKRICSFVLIIAMLAMFVPSGLVGTTVYAANFTPRLTAPERTGYYSNNTSTNPYSVNTNAGGGNCTWYAWGRAYEILGSRPKINTSGNACTWYTTNQSSGNYPYGSTPKLGAIACWSGGSGGAGHVAVVEQINSNGTMVISESSWSATDYWFRTATINQNGSRWSNYTFQGFIYLLDSATVVDDTPGKPTLYVTAGTAESATVFSWTAATNADYYNLEIYDSSDNLVHKEFEIYGLSFSKVLADGNYWSIVLPVKTSNWAWNVSDRVYFSVATKKYPGKPTLSVKAGSDTFATTFSWSATSDTEWYDLRVYKQSDGTKILEQKEIRGTSFSYTFASGSYYASLASCNGTYGTWTFADDYAYFTIEKSYFIPKATVYNDGHIYSLYDDAMTWTDAKARCERVGGHLVTITSASEQSIVQGLLSSGGRSYYWIGASDTETEGTFKWVTGEAFSYTNWDSGEPNDSNGEDYAQIYSTGNVGKWNDDSVNCWGKKTGFICEIETGGFDPVATDQYGRNLYELYDNKTAWSDAKVFAESNGGHLVSIASADENNFVFNLAKKGSKVGYYIGATNHNKSNWTWCDGSEFTYTQWNDSQPDNCAGLEYFGGMWTENGNWNDFENTCYDAVGFVIEYENAAAYTVTYDANGGTNAPEAQRKTKGENLTLTTDKPSRNGYEFIGWSTDKNATSPTYTAGAAFTTDADTTLYAVWKEITITSITVKTNPNKMEYNVGDYFEMDGLMLSAIYSDGYTKTIYTIDPFSLNDDYIVDSMFGVKCSPAQLNTCGVQEITVTYEGVSTSFNVTVNRVLTSVTVKTNPDKLVYTMGDTFDSTGLVLTASYNDGYTEDITSGFTCTPTELNTVGTQEITVEYEGKTTTFNVTVNKIVTSIFVMANPNKTTYSAGDTLDTTGMKLLVVYHDGSTQTITEGFTCTPTDLTTVGTQEITAEYGGKTATFEVTVKEAYSLKASPASEQTIGEPVVLTATGGSSYRFYYEQNGKWVNIRNFSTENACLWIPTVPRDYTIYVDIKDETGKVATSKRIEYTVTDAYPFTIDKEGEQNVGVNMTLTAKGGSSYKFYYEYNGAWCNITSNTTGVCEWSPKYAGNYMLYVDIKDANGKVIACRTQAFKLNDPFLLANDAQSTEFSYGRTVNFTAAGGNQYKFYYEKQGEWQRVQDFSSKNTCAWTPTEAGKYNFYCDIKDASGAVVSCKRMTFNITNPYSFTADKATTQSVGTKISFTATGGYQYKFYYEKDGSWVRIQSFSTENTCSWTPTVAGRYNVYCDIADENGTVLAYKGMEFVIGSVNADSYTFKTSVESPKPMNTAVILTATGGSSYKFYYEVGGKWATIQNFSTANTATWTPDMIADYTLYVDIKNASGKVVKTLSKNFSVTDPYSFTADVTSPQNIGKSVKLTATGGASYKFYYQYAGAWVKIQDSTSATCNWKPNKAGEYMVYVDIKNASGAVVTCRTMKLVFNDPYRFTTSASSLTQPAGTAISLSANGGTSYKFYYEKDGAWVRIQDYSTTKTCTWTPTEAGKYNVFCDIKDTSGSVAVCKRITFNITDRITITANKTNASVGDTLTFTATGGSSYKFYYEKDGAWVRIQSFSTSNTCNWKPTAAGDYVVYVDVNDENGNLIGCKGVRCIVQ